MAFPQNGIIDIAKAICRSPQRLFFRLKLHSLREELPLRRFYSMAKEYDRIRKGLDPNEHQASNYASGEDGYNWQCKSEEIKTAFTGGVPLNFLKQPTIEHTMVHRGSRKSTIERIDFILKVWTHMKARAVLREDYIGLPEINNGRFATSTNRSHHAYHLAYYEHKVKKSVEKWNNVIEWGGGYGDMARLVRKLNEKCTYTIFDLPELCALQYIYLYGLLGEQVNLVVPGEGPIIEGKINVAPVSILMSEESKVSAETFISTWGLTESPKEAQVSVFQRDFLGAKNILIASSPDGHNHLSDLLPGKGCLVEPIPILNYKHRYAFL